MSVTTIENNESINVDNLQKLLYNPNLIKRLATQLVAGQVKAHIEMIRHGSIRDGAYDDVETFNDACAVLREAKVSAEDFVEDMLQDFRDSLYEHIRLVEIDVKTVKLSAQGFEDADVEVR